MMNITSIMATNKGIAQMSRYPNPTMMDIATARVIAPAIIYIPYTTSLEIASTKYLFPPDDMILDISVSRPQSYHIV